MRFLLAAVLAAAPLAAYGDTVILGEARSDAPVVAIADLIENPTKFADQRIRVEGLVTDVCPMKGCWMQLASEKGMQVRVKVQDDVIVIPKQATGHQASAEGIVKVRSLARQEWIDWHSHLAEEKGEKFDASGVGDGPFQMVSLDGLGIEISMPEGN